MGMNTELLGRFEFKGTIVTRSNYRTVLTKMQDIGNLEEMSLLQDLLENIGIEVRICTKCKKFMVEGYNLTNEKFDSVYYCSDECLHQDYTDEDMAEFHDMGIGCWTQWNGMPPLDELIVPYGKTGARAATTMGHVFLLFAEKLIDLPDDEFFRSLTPMEGVLAEEVQSFLETLDADMSKFALDREIYKALLFEVKENSWIERFGGMSDFLYYANRACEVITLNPSLGIEILFSKLAKDAMLKEETLDHLFLK